MIKDKGLYFYFDDDDNSWGLFDVHDTHIPERDAEDFIDGTSTLDLVWVVKILAGDSETMGPGPEDELVYQDSYFSERSEKIIGDVFYAVVRKIFELRIKF